MAAPKETSVKEVFRALKDLNVQYNLDLNLFKPDGKWQKASMWSMILSFTFALLLTLLLGLDSSLNVISEVWENWLSLFILLLLLLFYVSVFVFQIIEFVKTSEDLKTIFRNPLTSSLEKVSEDCKRGVEFISRLQTLDRESISFVHDQVVHEHQAFASRVGLFVGAIDKVGVLPGLISLYISWQNLGASDTSNFTIKYTIPIAIASLYAFALYAHFSLLRLGMYASFLKFAKDN